MTGLIYKKLVTMGDLDKQNKLAEFISDGLMEEAVAYLKGLAESMGHERVIFDVLEPMLVSWGKLWMQGKLSLAHGYLSGKVAEAFYIEASANSNHIEGERKVKGTVVLGNIEDDFHPLGRKLVHVYSKAASWGVVDLENDVEPQRFVDEAEKQNADIIAVSAMMFTTAKNIALVRECIEKRTWAKKPKLAVGGAVFKLRPELINDVGGDGTADTAIDAPELFEKLLNGKA